MVTLSFRWWSGPGSRSLNPEIQFGARGTLWQCLCALATMATGWHTATTMVGGTVWIQRPQEGWCRPTPSIGRGLTASYTTWCSEARAFLDIGAWNISTCPLYYTFSRPGQSQGLLYKHLSHSLIHELTDSGRFCWMDGFCPLVVLHPEGSALQPPQQIFF